MVISVAAYAAITVGTAIIGSIANGKASKKAARSQRNAANAAIQFQAEENRHQRLDWRNQNKVDQWNGEWNRRLSLFNSTIQNNQRDQQLVAGYGVPGRVYGGRTIASPTAPARPTFETFVPKIKGT